VRKHQHKFRVHDTVDTSLVLTSMCRIYVQERPDAILPTMGGQTALNLAKGLSEVQAYTGEVQQQLFCSM